jgi:predicted RNA methylase
MNNNDKIMAIEELKKAVAHKYLWRIPNPKGKGYIYFYTQKQIEAYKKFGVLPNENKKKEDSTLKDMLDRIMSFFGLKSQEAVQAKIADDYNTQGISEKFSVTAQEWARHVAAYFMQKEKWDEFFLKKLQQQQKVKNTGAKTESIKEQKISQKIEKKSDKTGLNAKLMYFIFNYYNKDRVKPDGTIEGNRTDAVGSGSVNLSADNQQVHSGRTEAGLGSDVREGEPAINKGINDVTGGGSGERLGRDVRLTVSKVKEIRNQVMELLAAKSNEEMTEADKELLRQYEGAGGTGEKDRSTSGVLFEFYTPKAVISKMWELVDKYTGQKEGLKVLEPAAGTGRFAENKNHNFTMFEIEPTSSRINQILYPDAKLETKPFQRLFMSGNSSVKNYTGEKYDVVIGNPPYGQYSGIEAGLGEGKGHKRIDEYFIDRSLDTLKDGGILAFIVPSGFLRNKSNEKIKEKIAAKGKLLDAYRLPNGTFSTTGVGTDIIVIQKGKGDIQDYLSDGFFTKNPEKILGTETTRIGRFGEEKYVALDEGQTFDSVIDRIDTVEADTTAFKKQIEEKVDIVITGKSENNFDTMPESESENNFETMPESEEMQVGETYNIVVGGKEKQITISKKIGKSFEVKEEGIGGRILTSLFTKREVEEAKANGIKKATQIKKEVQPVIKKTKAGVIVSKKNDSFPEPITGEKRETETVESFNEKYNKSYSKEEISIWKKTDYLGYVETEKLTDADRRFLETSESVCRIDGRYMHIVNYASGDINKKMEILEDDLRSGKISAERYSQQKEILEKAMPQKLTVKDFSISPISEFAQNYLVSRVGEDGEGENQTLIDKFFIWAVGEYYGRNRKRQVNWNEGVSKADIPTGCTWEDIVDYIEQVPVVTEKGSAETKDERKMRALKLAEGRRTGAEKIFKRFLETGLSKEETETLEGEYNRRFNGYAKPDYAKIPLLLDGISKTFKGEKLTIKEKQVSGISFLANKGNGVLVHDVGLGKTMSAILATVNQIQSGRAKRPVICVPKAVSKNWLKEVSDLFPNVKINYLGNMSKVNTGFVAEEGSLTIITYQALSSITFKPETMRGGLLDDMYESQENEDDSDTDKEREAKRDKIAELVGLGARVKEGQSHYWEDLKFDHVTIDELHNFKNIFTNAQPRKRRGWDSKKRMEVEKRTANEFSGMTCGQSARGLKMFAIAQMVQRENNGRNMFGLSATPFTNSPIEIYNILSLFARNRLKELGIYNLHEFMAQFAKVRTEWGVDSKNNIVQKNVMKEFCNLTALQNLIREYMDRVDGEEAGIVRPKKNTHIAQVEMSDVQKAIYEVERKRFEKTSETTPGAALVAINNMRMATISPYLVKMDDGFYNDTPEGIMAKSLLKGSDFVEDSPKLKFTTNSVAGLYEKRPDVGQIIYMPRGVKQFDKVIDNLVKKGIPKNAIAVIDSDTDENKKDKIMEDFNNENGKIKVIIGSETIKEGVNLNGNTAAIYNLLLGWNPTETVQVEGRAWRQGNKQGQVHIVYPQLIDSVDAAMYQKHDEKGNRINALWSYKGNTVDVGEINPEDLKFDLIKDPETRAKFVMDLKIEEISGKMNDLIVEADTLTKYESDYQQYEREQKRIENNLPDYRESLEDMQKEYEEYRKTKEAELKERKKDNDYSYYENQAKRAIESYQRRIAEKKKDIREGEKKVKAYAEMRDYISSRLNARGITIESVDEESKKLRLQAQAIGAEIEEIRKNKDSYVEEARIQIEASRSKGKAEAPSVIAKKQVDIIAGNLKPMEEVLKEMQKAVKMVFERIYINGKVGLKYVGIN